MEGLSPGSHHNLDVRWQGSSIKHLRTSKAREKPKGGLHQNQALGLSPPADPSLSRLYGCIWGAGWGGSVGRGSRLRRKPQRGELPRGKGERVMTHVAWKWKIYGGEKDTTRGRKWGGGINQNQFCLKMWWNPMWYKLIKFSIKRCTLIKYMFALNVLYSTVPYAKNMHK